MSCDISPLSHETKHRHPLHEKHQVRDLRWSLAPSPQKLRRCPRAISPGAAPGPGGDAGVVSMALLGLNVSVDRVDVPQIMEMQAVLTDRAHGMR